MSKYPDNPGPLPALKLCNNFPPYNPVQGDGALGNQYRGMMFYRGVDRKELVETLQSMLVTLGYDVGLTGVDGKFGDNTEKGVRSFQTDNKNWDGTALDVDGLVGPETSDALNRSMVGIWYDNYQTPRELVEDKPYHTVTSDFLASGLSIEIDGSEEAQILLVGDVSKASISEVKWEKPEVVAFDETEKEDMKVKILVRTESVEDDREATVEVFQFKKDAEPTLLKKVEGLRVKNNEFVGDNDEPHEFHFEWHNTIYDYKRTQYFFKARVGLAVKAVEQKKDKMIRLKEFNGIVSNPDNSLPGATTEGDWLENYFLKNGPWVEATEDEVKKDGHQLLRYEGMAANVSKDKLSELVERNKFLHHQASHGFAACYAHLSSNFEEEEPKESSASDRGLTVTPFSGLVWVKPSGTVGPDGVKNDWCPICKNLDNVIGMIGLRKRNLNYLFEKDDVDNLKRSPKVLVFANCCQTAITDKYPKAWLAKGARWYIGWAKIVLDDPAVSFAKAFYKRWFEYYKMDPDKVGSAFNDVQAPYWRWRPRIFER